MPLSEEEQRVLDEMERQFRAPEARTSRPARPPEPKQKPAAPLVGIACAAGGLLILLFGFTRHPLIGLLGFVVMLVGAVLLRAPMAETLHRSAGRLLEQRPQRPRPPQRRRGD